MGYRGKERRRRFVYTTRNTEYHLLDDVCVAARDRDSGRWLPRHVALGRQVEGAVRTLPNGIVIPSLARAAAGEPMYFSLGRASLDRQLITSRVEAVGRPALTDLVHYPAA